MVTGHKDAKGDFHPHSGSKSGVSENDMKISVKGNNDVIKIRQKRPRKVVVDNKKIDKELEFFWNTLGIQVRPDVLQQSGDLQDDPFFHKYLYGSDKDFRKLNTIDWNDIPKHLQLKIKKYYLENEA